VLLRSALRSMGALFIATVSHTDACHFWNSGSLRPLPDSRLKLTKSLRCMASCCRCMAPCSLSPDAFASVKTFCMAMLSMPCESATNSAMSSTPDWE